MRFKLILRPEKDRQHLLFNYQYPLMAWLYGLLHRADADYADFLHRQGYAVPDSRKSFKHFTFSSLLIPRMEKPRPGDTYMVLRSREIELIVSFYLDRAAEGFVVGLFQNQRLSLFNQQHRADFVVERVETLPRIHEKVLGSTLGFGPTSMVFSTLSPLVVAEKVGGLDQYLAPTDARYPALFALNLVDKYRSLVPDALPAMDAATAAQLVKFRLLPEQNRIKTRKIVIKEGKEAQTKVVGYHHFHFEVTAPPELLELGYLGGFGKYCANGMGCVEVVEKVPVASG